MCGNPCQLSGDNITHNKTVLIPFVCLGFARTGRKNLGPTRRQTGFCRIFHLLQFSMHLKTKKRKITVIPFVFLGVARNRTGDSGPDPPPDRRLLQFSKHLKTKNENYRNFLCIPRCCKEPSGGIWARPAVRQAFAGIFICFSVQSIRKQKKQNDRNSLCIPRCCKEPSGGIWARPAARHAFASIFKAFVNQRKKNDRNSHCIPTCCKEPSGGIRAHPAARQAFAGVSICFSFQSIQKQKQKK